MTFNSVKYLGGAPYPFDRVCMVDVTVNNFSRSLIITSQNSSATLVLNKNEILNAQADIKNERSIGKGVVGYCIGNFINKRYGGLIGAAIGGRRHDVSNLYINYLRGNRAFTIILNPGKKTWDLYAAINSLIP